MKLKLEEDLILPQHLVSRIAGWLCNLRVRWVKSFLIRFFIKHCNVNMSEVANDDLDTYPTFNSFFTRQLRPEARPIAAEPNAIISPVDGEVSEIGNIEQDTIIQAKNHNYKVVELLTNHQLARQLENGTFCTLYLSPAKYHRVHMPLAAQLTRLTYVPGCLYSVRKSHVENIDHIFTRNERVICEFQLEQGIMVMVLVGAYRVGNIFINCHGQVAPSQLHCVQTWDYSEKQIILSKGQELGYFAMGSTVIVLFPSGLIQWNASIQQATPLLMGESLATLDRY